MERRGGIPYSLADRAARKDSEIAAQIITQLFDNTSIFLDMFIFFKIYYKNVIFTPD